MLVAKGAGKSKDETKFEYRFEATGTITDIREYYKSQFSINDKWDEMMKYKLVYNKQGLLSEMKYTFASYLLNMNIIREVGFPSSTAERLFYAISFIFLVTATLSLLFRRPGLLIKGKTK